MALEFNKVVAVIDIDDHLAPMIIKTAASLTAASGELHAIDSNPFITTFESPYAAGAIEADAKAHQADADRRQEAMEALTATHSPNATVAVLDGDPSRDAASSESSDMLREAPCAVFVVTEAYTKRLGA